jgi:16S rRNA (guanine966-N2)-methyltransferase
MRVVGGSLRGRSLAGPKTKAIRPTADRLRESLFNILAHAYADPVSGARVRARHRGVVARRVILPVR